MQWYTHINTYTHTRARVNAHTKYTLCTSIIKDEGTLECHLFRMFLKPILGTNQLIKKV